MTGVLQKALDGMDKLHNAATYLECITDNRVLKIATITGEMQDFKETIHIYEESHADLKAYIDEVESGNIIIVSQANLNELFTKSMQDVIAVSRQIDDEVRELKGIKDGEN